MFTVLISDPICHQIHCILGEIPVQLVNFWTSEPENLWEAMANLSNKMSQWLKLCCARHIVGQILLPKMWQAATMNKTGKHALIKRKGLSSLIICNCVYRMGSFVINFKIIHRGNSKNIIHLLLFAKLLSVVVRRSETETR